MINPWEILDLKIYENHMKLANVNQLKSLNKIMKSQFYSYDVDSIGIWGIAGGNGLEHISCNKFKKIYGIDFNQNYLNVTKNRYQNLSECLFLKNLDLNDLAIDLPEVDLVIANLIIEFMRISNFIAQIKRNPPQYLSCVLQKDNNNTFVSDSPYLSSLKNIFDLSIDIDKNELINSLNKIDFNLTFEKKHELPNKKEFIRLDFKKSC